MFKSNFSKSAGVWICVLAVALGPCLGCGGGSGSQIPGVQQGTAFLAEDGRSYSGPNLETPRYGHSATAMRDGRVLILGGSDERFLTSLSDAEIFDQTLFSDPVPESLAGAFIDTDFTGNPMIMVGGGRVFHQTTLLPNDDILITGGSRDILIAEATPRAEIFDTARRVFSPDDKEIVNDMVEPRFRHSATLLPNGKVLITGGQISVSETFIDDNFPPGHPLFSVTVETFPSTTSLEIYDPTTRSFEVAEDISGFPSELNTARGRTDFASATVAGPDGVLGNTDDIVIMTSGYQTQSLQFAPTTKLPQQLGNTLLSGVEYYDPSTGLTTAAPNITTIPRTNGPSLVNLGEFRDDSVDGVSGLNNLLLLTHGDDNDFCRTSPSQSEIVSVTFTGFGPADGIQFASIQHDALRMGSEVSFALGEDCNVGRTGAPVVVMPTLRTYDGVLQQSNWVITAGGEYLFCSPGQVRGITGVCLNEVQGFMMFDPLYHPFSDPPWDQSRTRGQLLGVGGVDLNPTGVMGGWLDHDGVIPDNDLVGYAGPAAADLPLVELRARRGFHTMTRVPGFDGIPGTNDDRVLIVGGGLDVPNNGGEPVSISSEIYLPPGANLSP